MPEKIQNLFERAKKMINEANCAKNCDDYKNGVCKRDQCRPINLEETIAVANKEGIKKICSRSNFRTPALNKICRNF